MNKFSIILPYVSNSEYINICKDFLYRNTVNEFELIEIIDKPHVYTNFNNGVLQSSNEIVVMIHDDMIFSPGWDLNIFKYCNDSKLILTMNVIEPGNIGVSEKNH